MLLEKCRHLKTQMKYTNNKGFTLIELLVVISIIGFLSSVVLASLSTARLKARDSLIISEVLQLRTLLESEYSENNSYANLQTNGTTQWWLNTVAQCNAGFRGNYHNQAAAICINIVNNSDGAGWWGDFRLHLGVETSTPANNTHDKNYSIMVWLPGKKAYYCIGSSGQTSNTTDGSPANWPWGQPGCWQNP